MSLREEALRRAVAELPETEREVIQLRYGLNGERAVVARGDRAQARHDARARAPDRVRGPRAPGREPELGALEAARARERRGSARELTQTRPERYRPRRVCGWRRSPPLATHPRSNTRARDGRDAARASDTNIRSLYCGMAEAAYLEDTCKTALNRVHEPAAFRFAGRSTRTAAARTPATTASPVPSTRTSTWAWARTSLPRSSSRSTSSRLLRRELARAEWDRRDDRDGNGHRSVPALRGPLPADARRRSRR